MKPAILIVEDEPAIADTIQFALETEGCTTLTAFAGAPALSLLAGQPVPQPNTNPMGCSIKWISP